MEQQSSFLSYILAEAAKLQQEDGKISLTANYFAVSLIDLILAWKKSKLPKGLSADAAAEELAAAERLLSAKGEVSKTLREGILDSIHRRDYNSMVDEFLYRKSLFRVRERARKEGVTLLTADFYLSVLLENPTAALREYLGLPSSDPRPATPPPTPPATETATAAAVPPPFHVPTATVTDDTEAEATPPARPSGRRASTKKTAAAESAAFDLAAAVAGATKLQNAILEKVVGQDLAVSAFASGYFQGQLVAATQKKRRGPLSSFLFAGPPGVGKTFLAETAAEAIGLPFLRVDMSEYADDDSLVEFCGSDNVYKNGKEGNITKFIKENPRCFILFDEIEKAHLCIIHLFLQILDSGSIRDNFTDTLVSFRDAIIVFTTNVGRKLYEDPTVRNLAMIPRKQVLDAIATERNPEKKDTLMFPTAVCSRFASGNVLMFNHLGTDNLYYIAKNEIDKHVSAFRSATNLEVTVDEKVPTALIFAAGGKADARTVRGRAASIFHDEMYELLRLMAAAEISISDLREVRVEVSLDKCTPDAVSMFTNTGKPSVLVFADQKVVKSVEGALDGIEVVGAEDLDTAKTLLYSRDFSLILCDILCGADGESKVLNAEDVESAGQEFLSYVLSRHSVPTYLIEEKAGSISSAEFLSFARMGVREVLPRKSKSFAETVRRYCDIAYQQEAINRLARESKVLSYKTAQTLSDDGTSAVISFGGFRFTRATDADDTKSVLDAAQRPNVRFPDVIGAEDAKRELGYFVEYLKNPKLYARRGLHAPKGVLLYGPPGTGKTLLAKAIAGESDVTFLATEGNRFLKRFQGEGAAAVHDLFRTARKYAPAIIFVDEIDAIGKDRSEGRNDESIGDVLTAFLTEMDGFNQDATKPVFVLAATNYAVDKSEGKTLDPALLRRFDRRIYVDLPNKDERRRFCEMRMAKSPAIELSPEELDNIAIRSVGMSLAELESVFEMALRGAVHSQDGKVGDAVFEEAFETFTSGEARTRNEESVRRTACHEAGHALLCWLSGECPSYLTVVSRGDHGGYMQHGDTEEKGVYTRAELRSLIRTSLAGRAAELVFYGAENGVTTGPSADLASATRTAEAMICRYGMDQEMGLAALPSDPSSPYYAEIRRRINEILREELTVAMATVERNRAAMSALIEALVERNRLMGNEIDEILKKTAIR
jgi:ATP-dependent metalloprotease FtsH